MPGNQAIGFGGEECWDAWAFIKFLNVTYFGQTFFNVQIKMHLTNWNMCMILSYIHILSERSAKFFNVCHMINALFKCIFFIRYSKVQGSLKFTSSGLSFDHRLTETVFVKKHLG